ncbi:hypothetical protein [Cellvibrio sp. pealriver]|nr:hypothetical protein [Cellvibrio sp. pealriver]
MSDELEVVGDDGGLWSPVYATPDKMGAMPAQLACILAGWAA